MRLREEARTFLLECYAYLGKSDAVVQSRWHMIEQEIQSTGSYAHTFEELHYGVKAAWRNSNRCIGRFFWNTIHLFDAREATSEEEIRDALLRHIEYATNGGKIRPAITVFRAAANHQERIRIWNHQLIRYAGFETETGVIGDPHSLPFTKKCLELGWAAKQEPFEILPLVFQIGDRPPALFEIPKEYVLEVPISHPHYSWFDELSLRWYAVPIISEMRLEVGGIPYTAAPFNGWYMETEIGARNFADEDRFHMLPQVAAYMGLDTSTNASFWKDKALIELNLAVHHSYKEAGVSIVDHHTAAQQFKMFEQQEQEAGRRVTGDWTWLIPPVSPATTHIFHKSYDNTWLSPNFFYQEKPY
ncbi:nitric oxide synthase oxygenase [Brevibacillus ruminantium]|uniref:Nitric oxide synthase oxygenase n=1 Tax=Brevibacillus ruminantium TaxID=2950604 RepID=A0ABY4WV11_9BACL|nr:nitric oxide synthase oxygenase [Brevibacillus ruminantium]USG68426.1 nitric oxide synthase oxygenase [Brevibacillus ruminantium]